MSSYYGRMRDNQSALSRDDLGRSFNELNPFRRALLKSQMYKNSEYETQIRGQKGTLNRYRSADYFSREFGPYSEIASLTLTPNLEEDTEEETAQTT
jgi:hypothetical protein